MDVIGLLDLHTRAVSEYGLGSRDPHGSPFMEAERVFLELTDRPSNGISKRAINWTSKLYSFERFTVEVGRAPREHTRNARTLPADERRLGEWAGYQRRMQDRLSRFQWIRLDLSAAFEWDPHEALWQARSEEYRAYVERAGRQPFLNSDDPAEFRLARWTARQLRLLQSGHLPADRATRFHALIRGARGDSTARAR